MSRNGVKDVAVLYLRGQWSWYVFYIILVEISVLFTTRFFPPPKAYFAPPSRNNQANEKYSWFFSSNSKNCLRCYLLFNSFPQ